mgnify:CR=1 FL=1
MNDYLDSVIERDPAARNRLNVLLNYPGVKAFALYKISHFLWNLNLYLLARMVSQFARFLTNVEIHPGAKIGKNLFWDHASGVIGESSVIGDNCTLYQNVTLGGLSPSENSKEQIGSKRHPTIDDNVIVGSGAQILGPVIIGKNSRIGANAVVLKDVPANITYVGVPARKIETKKVAKTLIPATIPNSVRILISVVAKTKKPTAVVKFVIKVIKPIVLITFRRASFLSFILSIEK